jgi:uncharacterized membrane protein
MKNKLIIFVITISLLLSIPTVIIANGERLSVQVENIVLDRQGDNIITVMDMIGLKNVSNDDIISNSSNPEIKFQVPNNAQQIAVNIHGAEEMDFEKIDENVVIYQQLPPERSMEFSISYFLEIDSDNLDISIMREYPVNLFNVYVPVNSGLSIQSSQLVESGVMNINQRSFNYYSFANLQANDLMEIQIQVNEDKQITTSNNRVNQGYDGFHNPGHIRFWESSPLSNFNPHLVTFVFVVLIVFAIVYYFYRWRIDEQKNAKQSSQEDDVFIRLYKEESLLKKKLAEIQLALDDGEINEEEYIKRRDIYKKKLINVKLKIKEFTE